MRSERDTKQWLKTSKVRRSGFAVPAQASCFAPSPLLYLSLLKSTLSGLVEMKTCETCEGTGIEEGREWDGEKCRECKGRGWIHVDDIEDDESSVLTQPGEPNV